MNNSEMPAMPTEQSTEHFSQASTHYSTGLTKREHFAGLAMQGLISAGVNGLPSAEEIAFLAVKGADALLLELSK